MRVMCCLRLNTFKLYFIKEPLKKKASVPKERPENRDIWRFSAKSLSLFMIAGSYSYAHTQAGNPALYSLALCSHKQVLG